MILGIHIHQVMTVCHIQEWFKISKKCLFAYFADVKTFHDITVLDMGATFSFDFRDHVYSS